MSQPQTNEQTYVKLRDEYHATLRVLSVLVERQIGTGEAIEVDDATLYDAPDLLAYRDEANGRILLSVTR